MNQEANIDIMRKGNKLSSVSVVMPIWDKQGQDDVLVIEIPLLGMKTFAKDENDAEVAVQESIELFCLNAEKFGKGLESELKILGWSFNNQDTEFTSMSFNSKNVVYDHIMQTGEQVAHKLELELELA
jgi:hypothetical protein